MEHVECLTSIKPEQALLVKRIAYHLMSRLPNTVQFDDLIQAGMIGLIEATRRYDDKQAASFETFASLRIRGAMLDDLRKSSWMSRSTHKNMRKISEAVRSIEARKNRRAKTTEIAKELKVTLDEYNKMARTAYANELVSFEQLTDNALPSDTTAVEPEASAERDDLLNKIARYIKTLPEREKMIITLYYTEKLTFKEIGSVLNLTEARICQLHGQALARLNAKINQ